MKNFVLKDKKPNIQKIIAFGFKKSGKNYVFNKSILNNQFMLTISITPDGNINTQVIDLSSDEEYTLHLMPAAQGSFVGNIKAEYENTLNLISKQCFDNDVYKNPNTIDIIKYIDKKYDNELEFLWETSKTSSIIRRKDTKKWYAVFMIIPKNRLIKGEEGLVEVMDLRADPDIIDSLFDNKIFFPGFHMNKKHWFTVCFGPALEKLPNTVQNFNLPLNKIYKLIDSSYNLAVK